MTETKLIMASEAGKIIGCSRQRLHQLSMKDPDFPKPEIVTSSAKLWDPKKIKAYAKKQRPGGRPRKAAAS